MGKLNKAVQLNALIMLRNELCGKKHLLPYQIYTVPCAKAVVEAQPQTLEELGRVKGFPENGQRYRKYGESILYTLRNADSIQEFVVTPSEDGEADISPVLKKMSCF